MVAQQGTEAAMDIRTERLANQASVGVEALPTSLRSSGVGVTESNLTVGTRAQRTTTSGSLAGDEFFESDTGYRYRWDGTKWLYETGVYVASEATRTGLSISANDNGALLLTTDNSSSGLILWQVASGSWTKRLQIQGTTNQVTAAVSSGVLTLSLPASVDISTSLKIGGTKVVGAQGAAVADATGGANVDAEARAAINDLLARARAHGLIAT